MRADGDSYFNFLIMNVKSDGRHSKQVQNLVPVYLLSFKKALPFYAEFLLRRTHVILVIMIIK